MSFSIHKGWSVPNRFIGALLVLIIFGSLAFSATGDVEVLVADRKSGRLLQSDEGLLTYRPLPLRLKDPHGLTCGPDGYIYAAEPAEERIVRFRPQEGNVETVARNIGGIGRSAETPVAIAFGPQENLYLITREKGVWYIPYPAEENEPVKALDGNYFDHDEAPFDLVPLSQAKSITDLLITVTTDRPLKGYVLKLRGPEFERAEAFIDNYQEKEYGLRKEKHLKVPTGIAVGSCGNLFIVDRGRGERHILKYNPDGSFQEVLVEQVIDPIDISTDDEGNLYVTLGPLTETKPGGGLKVYNSDGGEQYYLPRSGLWGLAICNTPSSE
ncbi:MAG: hypothetical protein ACOCZX_05400 [Candidatus Bipolaricaulota bacterium]